MKIKFIVGHETKEVQAEEGRSLLDMALIAGMAPPYSCMEGHCESCRALVNGKHRLTCQTVPSSMGMLEDLVVDYNKG